MIVRQLKAVLRPFKARLVPNFNDYLGKVDGLVHVGANTGQERDLYESYGLEVIWIEPIPDVFAELQENIKGHPRQSAYQELITDSDGKEYEFRVASNHGQSSSIMDFKLHKDIWPDIQFTNTMHLRGITLATFFAQQGLDVKRFKDRKSTRLNSSHSSVSRMPSSA